MSPDPFRVHISRFDTGDPAALQRTMQETLEGIRLSRLLRADSRVFIKPNFTYPFPKNGVTTTPAALEALIAVLRQTTSRITVVESNGGANAWQAEQSFAGHRLPDLAARYGIEALNLTNSPREVAKTEIAGREVSVELSSR